MNLKNIGNIKNFKNPQRIVEPKGLIITPKLILKKYDMYTEIPSDKQTINLFDTFLMEGIEKKFIDAKSGFGFAILSRDMLNIIKWDKTYTIVAVNQLYEFPVKGNKRKILESKLVNISDFGAYCVWELGIVNHERKVWIEYLNSKKTELDKIKYLKSTIKGGL